MASEVKVPTWAKSVSEATIGQWLKQPGEAVAVDEPIVSLETDKVAIEVNAPVAGVMGQQLVKLGDTVAVGALIATIEAGGGAAAAPESRARVRRQPVGHRRQRCAHRRSLSRSGGALARSAPRGAGISASTRPA